MKRRYLWFPSSKYYHIYGRVNDGVTAGLCSVLRLHKHGTIIADAPPYGKRLCLNCQKKELVRKRSCGMNRQNWKERAIRAEAQAVVLRKTLNEYADRLAELERPKVIAIAPAPRGSGDRERNE